MCGVFTTEVIAAVSVAVRLALAAHSARRIYIAGLYKVMMRAKRWIPPEMPQMPVCQAYVEGQRALQGSWERGRHIRSCAIRRDRELNIAKSNMWLLSGGKTRENSLGLWRSTVWSGQRSQTTSKCSRLTDTRGKMEIITHAQCKYV